MIRLCQVRAQNVHKMSIKYQLHVEKIHLNQFLRSFEVPYLTKPSKLWTSVPVHSLQATRKSGEIMAEIFTGYILTTHQLETLLQKKTKTTRMETCSKNQKNAPGTFVLQSKLTKVHAGIRFSVSSSSEQKCCSLYMCPSMAAGFEASTLAKWKATVGTI